MVYTSMSEPLFKWESSIELGALLANLEYILMPLREQKRLALYNRAHSMMKEDRISEAIGDTINRACMFLDNVEKENK